MQLAVQGEEGNSSGRETPARGRKHCPLAGCYLVRFFAYGSIRLLSSVLRSRPYFFLVLWSLFRFAVSERKTLMPILDSTDHSMPRSALRHCPIKAAADQQGKRPSVAVGITPVAQRASRLRFF